MNAKRTTITISHELYERALAVMHSRLIDDFSGFVQILIREEYERRLQNVSFMEELKVLAATKEAVDKVPEEQKRKPNRKRTPKS